MTLTELVFHAFILLTAGAAVALALSKNIVYAAFLLFVVLLGVAGLYVFAGAEFLAVSQVIVYVGGTLIVVLFGVMLTAKMRELKPQTELTNVIPGALLAIGLLMTLLFVIRESGVTTAVVPATAVADNTRQVGIATLTDYLLPFELISVLLLTVLIGAAYLGRKLKTDKEEATP
jgi:NADH-quinone oxidoreductase subunit J